MRAQRAGQMNFIDIHTHLLPGLDDGSTSLLETLEMARVGYDRGTRAMVATPHAFLPPFEPRPPLAVYDRFADTVSRLQRLARSEENAFLREMSFHFGCEYFVSPEFLEALDSRQIFTLNGSRYLLVEFPQFLAFDAVSAAVSRVLDSGLLPVLAHIERYSLFRGQGSRVEALRRRGCVLQVNASSIVEDAGQDEAEAAWSFAREGLVDVIASDAHDAHDRAPDLGSAWERLAGEIGREFATLWMWENPARIVANRELVSA